MAASSTIRRWKKLEGLAEAAGARVVGQLTQRRPTPDAATYLGKGKLQELHERVEATDADCIIFDNDLSPGQTRNLEEVVKIKVLDRTELILDIFANRARNLRVPSRRRTGATGVLAAAVETHVDASFATAQRHRSSRTGRKAVGIRSAARGKANQRSPRRTARGPPPPRTRSRHTAGFYDRLAGRLHQCGQEHAAEFAHRGPTSSPRTPCFRRSTREPDDGSFPAGGRSC